MGQINTGVFVSVSMQKLAFQKKIKSNITMKIVFLNFKIIEESTDI